MQSRIDEQTAEVQFKQVMDQAANNRQRFIIDRQDGSAVVIMSVQDYIRLAIPAPDWLQKAWKGAKERGIDTMTMEEIDAEIADYRREKALALEQTTR